MGTKKSARERLPALPVPQSREQANALIAKIGELQRQRAEIQTALDRSVAVAKSMAEDQAVLVNAEIAQNAAAVQAYCGANRAPLTDGGKTKTVEFAAGEVSWRLRPRSVSFTKGTKAEDIVNAIKELGAGFRKFLRVKTEVDKEAMLKHSEQALRVPGVRIGSAGEDFIIKPVSLQLEEIVR